MKAENLIWADETAAAIESDREVAVNADQNTGTTN
jgi:hypothetical protein